MLRRIVEVDTRNQLGIVWAPTAADIVPVLIDSGLLTAEQLDGAYCEPVWDWLWFMAVLPKDLPADPIFVRVTHEVRKL